MGGDAKRDAWQAGGDEAGNAGVGAERDDEGQWAGPMRSSEVERGLVERAKLAGCCKVRDVDDQRVEARATLGGVDPHHGFGIGRVGREPVDGLGRDRDGESVEDYSRRRGDRFIVKWQDAERWMRHGSPAIARQRTSPRSYR